MERPPADFAHPVAKTVGCFVAVLMLPGALVANAISPTPLPPQAFYGSGVITTVGLLLLCNRPSIIQSALDAIVRWLTSRKD